ncbi:glycosyltransferase [Rubripirellula reticaptiva]|uniref:Capsular glucan synthase n=1 Tax=Rubripirellula reticaptiva TaxID=2528013 RepID=A0A5C6FDX9_9BACT|nr:glycosyltransferase [Rubripirellula reticaptiva]TWU58306.1 Capsular glucan synthase [Rubripirellula reticaptiva]
MRIAHLTAFMHGGASALQRIHGGLRQADIDSHVFAVCDGESSPSQAIIHLPVPRPSKWDRRKSKWASRLHIATENGWQARIKTASKGNADYEAFSPPAALVNVDLSPVLASADVLHVHWTGDVVDYRTFFGQIDIPVVWTLHDQNPYLGGFHYQGDVDAATGMLDLEYECRQIKRDAISNLKLAVVGNSRWNLQQSASTDVLPKTAIKETIYLPLPIENYSPLDKHKSKIAIGIPADRFVIGFACAAMGNRRKGLADLLHAMTLLPESIQKKTTLISFGHPPSKTLQQRIPIQWLHQGQLNGGAEQSPIYSAMDVFVFPSIEEAFGQTALESMACQTPVVGTAVGGIPEMVIDGQTGLLTPPRSPGLLCDAIIRLHDDAHAREAMGAAGRELAIAQHSPKQITQQHIDLYQRLCST